VTAYFDDMFRTTTTPYFV